MAKLSKTRKRIVAVAVGTSVFLGTLTAALHFTEASAYAARVTLRGIEDIVSNHSFKDNADNPKPFTIVEVVPTMNDASIGYLVGGEEPIDNGRSIKDMPSKEERNRYINGYVQDAVEPHDWIQEVNQIYDPTIDPSNNPNNQRPNLTDSDGRAYDIAYDLNEKAFYWSEYHEPILAEDGPRYMDIRGSFSLTDDGSGPYVAGDSVTGLFTKVYGNGTDTEPDVYAVDDPANGPYGKTAAQLGFELYRQTVVFRPSDETYTGHYIFNLKLLEDDSVMPLSAYGTYPDQKYNWQYFAANKIEDTDSFSEGDIVYAADASGAGSQLVYFGQVINDGGDLKIKLSDGTIISMSDLEGGSYVPAAASGPLMMSRRSASLGTPTPTASVTPTPTLESDGTPDPNATPTATPDESDGSTPTATPGAVPTGTPDGGPSDPTPEPTTAPESTTAPGGDSSDPTTPVTDPATDPVTDPATDPTLDGGSGNTASIKAFNNGYYSYRGVKTINDTAVLGKKYAPINPDGTATYDYYVVYEDNGTASSCYVIEEGTISSASAGPFGRKEGYTQILGDEYNASNAPVDKGPYYKKTGEMDEYAYDPGHYSTASAFYEFITDYRLDVYNRFEYAGGFNNNEWFKKYVFDRTTEEEINNLSVDVVTVKLEDLGEHIDDADLIYFAGGRYPDEADKDISVADAIKIYSKVVNDNFPVMLERSTYYANESAANTKNLQLLALLLMQSNYKDVPVEEDWGYILADAPEAPYSWEDLLDGLVYASYIPQDPSTMDPDRDFHDLSYVHGTIFMNDDCDWILTDVGGGIYELTFEENPQHKIVRSDFITKYSDAKLTGSIGINGFTEITAEFDNERPIIETYGKWDDFNSEISKATCIRYILNANNNRYAVKTVLNILDLEPYETVQYSIDDLNNELGPFVKRDVLEKDWIRDNLDFEGDLNKIGITQIGTREFVGMNQDINATYDMVYIGMDTTLMNTDYVNGAKGNSTKYNNSSMNGLIYAHMGDTYKYGEDHPSGNAVTSGNDITFDKKRDLEEYIKAGYSVILSDSFFVFENDAIKRDGNGYVSINETTLDKSSNMYKLIHDVVLATNNDGRYIYFGKNVFYKSALEAKTQDYKSNREIFARYLNISKLTIKVDNPAVDLPIAYNYNAPADDRYLQPDYNGDYYLRYKVTLENDAALSSGGTTYDCKLYLDLDADGKYEEGEAQTNLVINGGAEGQGSDGKYHLSAGNTYTVERIIPDEFVGFIAWKLAFIQNGNSLIDAGTGNEYSTVRSALIGYSAVPAQGAKPVVNILQITEGGNTFDLNSSAMQDLYKEVQDFDVKVYKVSLSNFLSKNASSITDLVKNPSQMSYFENMCQYDMLVFGFRDSYNLSSGDISVSNGNGKSTNRSRDDVCNDLMVAIREYAMSGRSILFTHDLSSFNAIDTGAWGYYVNNYLRDLQGMDRYGYTAQANQSRSYRFDGVTGTNIKTYNSVYDNHYMKGQEQSDNLGLTDSVIIRYASDGSRLGINNWATNYYDVPSGDKESVTAINEGQITRYPFLITEGVGGAQRNGGSATSTFDVAYTHGQYYQLNLDTDSRDDNTNDDVVVWYTISNSGETGSGRYNGIHPYYRSLHNDVRNNYYLYSKGNILYTGAGHHEVVDDLERKLFVNTLVASYNSGLHAPKVLFKENPWDSSANVAGIYMPYDVNMTQNEAAADETGGFLDDKINVNFKTTNNNFRESNAPLNVQYYVKSNVPADLNIGTDYYKKITPVSFKAADATGNLTDLGVAGAYTLENYKVYQASFKVADLQSTAPGTVNISDQIKIYIQIGTQGLSTGTVTALDATESLPGNELSVFTAKLFDLE